MGIILQYTEQKTKTDPITYRRRYPKALLPYIPGNSDAFKRSLVGNDIQSPVVLGYYGKAQAEYDRIVAIAKKKEGRVFDTLAAPIIAFLAREFENGWRKEANKDWTWTPPDDSGELTVNDMMLNDFGTWKTERDLTEMVGHWTTAAEGLVEQHGLVLDPDDPDRLDELCAALNSAAIDVCISIQRGTQGDLKPQIKAPVSGVSKGSSHDQEETFEALVERVMALPQSGVSSSVRRGVMAGLRSFGRAFGQPVPSQITRTNVTEWISLLARCPTRLTRSERQKSLQEVVKLYEGRDDVIRLAPQTYRGHVTYLAARWDDIQRSGWIGEDHANPFRNHKTPKNVPSRTVTGFSAVELKQIFDLPIFTAGVKPAGGKGETSYWLPLILFTTGARPEEVCQMLVCDIFQNGIGDWVMRYTDEGEHPHKGHQSLKTDGGISGRRTIPVPKVLLERNFVGYVESLKAAGETALFPRLRVKDDRNQLHSGFAEWWGDYLRENGILRPAAIETRQPTRGFRHVWNTAAIKAKVPREAREYIMGHKDGGGNAQRQYGDWQALGEYNRSVNPHGPDWSKVIPWTP